MKTFANWNAPTPASFWSYQAPETPSHAEAVECGAINADKLPADAWERLTPGMRREIVRSHKRKTANA